MKTIRAIFVLLSAYMIQASACEITSGPMTVALVELFTSEGCSSCPPADRWFSRFVRINGDMVVTLSFHVDYWDKLGWRDRFASPRYSRRQHDLVAAAGGHTVYTPQIFIDSGDWAAWNDPSGVMDTLDRVRHRPAEAKLNLKISAVRRDRWEIGLSGNIFQPAPQQNIWLAVYEDGLFSRIDAGENRGEQLRHDRVVRQWLGPYRTDRKGRIKVAREIDAPFQPGKGGVVAFVEDMRAGKVLQAVSLPFCDLY